MSSREKLKNFLAHINSENLEVEARIKNVGKLGILNLEKNLIKFVQPIKSETTVYLLQDDIRKIVEGDKVKYEKKNNKFYTIEDDIKYSVSSEIPISPPDHEEIEKIRKRKRRSYHIKDLIIDVTVINDEDWEIEIEKNKASLSTFFNFIDYANTTMKDNVQYKVISFMNRLLSKGQSTKYKELDYQYLSRPRDMKIADLNENLLKYTASLKADGIQYFLVFYEGVYLVNQKNIEVITKEKHELDGNIYLGEYVEDEGIKRFMPYDTISVKYISVVEKDYLTRYKFTESVQGYKNDVFRVSKKEIFQFETPQDFFDTMKKLLRSTHSFVTDGIIFTPINSPYVAEGQNQNIKKRVISDYDDVLKYKPIDRLSIDFYISEDNQLKVFDSHLNKNVIFKGSENNSFDEKNILWPEDKTKYINKIYEFEFYQNTDYPILRPTRERKDKSNPNGRHVAADTWDLINNPIDKSTMAGEDTRLMRYYHNDIKREMISWVGNDLLLDIGGGKGGDIDKWRHSRIHQILSIEPNEEYIEEFKKRLIKAKPRGRELMSEFVKVEQGYGQDMNNVKKAEKYFDWKNIGNRNLYITFMLSLTFFFDSNEEYKKLANVIKEVNKLYYRKGGKGEVFILYFVMDGNKVKMLENNKVYKYNTTTLKRINNYVEIDITDSKTVHSQTEYLTEMNKFLQECGYIEYEEHDANKRFFMSDSEKELSSFYIYGKAVKNNHDYSIQVNINKKINNHAYNDDKIIEIKENIFRVSCINEDSFTHSYLKLTSKTYRSGNLEKRLELASFYYEYDDYCIIIFRENRIMNEDKKYCIFMIKHKDGNYEPLVWIENKKWQYSFKTDSDLFKKITEEMKTFV